MKTRRLDDGRILLDSGSPWEPRMGYSRAVRIGPRLLVAGCVGVELDGSYAPSLGRQAARALERIADALRQFDAGLDAIVRMRIYTTRIDRWEEIAAVVGPACAACRPANALIGVAALIDPSALIEIEVEAWLGREDGPQGGDREHG